MPHWSRKQETLVKKHTHRVSMWVFSTFKGDTVMLVMWGLCINYQPDVIHSLTLDCATFLIISFVKLDMGGICNKK